MARSGLERDVTVIGAEVIQPVDIQSRYAQTVQTHNAVSVPTVTWSTESAWHDADGFDKVAFTLMNDSATIMSLQVQWSNDGVSYQGLDTVITGNTARFAASSIDVKARYFKVTIYNGDTAAHTMSAWAYLKA